MIVFSAKMIILIIFFTSTAYAELKLDSVRPNVGLLGQDSEVTLTGVGFDANTRVSMRPDAGNKREIIGSVNTPNEAHGVAVIGDKAYMVDSESGLQIIDITNPTNPKIIGSVNTGYTFGLTVVGGTAYVASGSGLQVVDISNPTNPKIIGSMNTPGYNFGVTVVDSKAYAADGPTGIQMIDVSDPTFPLIIGSVDTFSGAKGIAVTGDKVYVADDSAGLVIVPVPAEIKPVNVNNATSISVILPSPIMACHYTLRAFNETESHELPGALTLLEFEEYQKLVKKKAMIVAGYRSYPDDILWDKTQLSANMAYRSLLTQG